MDNNLDKHVEEALKTHRASGIEDQVDYQKFYLYSIGTHYTAIKGSTGYELGFIPSIVRKEDKGEYIQSLVDSRETEDSSIVQDTLLRHHFANLNRRVLEYKESIRIDY